MVVLSIQTIMTCSNVVLNNIVLFDGSGVKLTTIHDICLLYFNNIVVFFFSFLNHDIGKLIKNNNWNFCMVRNHSIICGKLFFYFCGKFFCCFYSQCTRVILSKLSLINHAKTC